MRKLLVALFLFCSVSLSAQKLTVYDLYIIKEIYDIELTNYFLQAHTSCKYVGNLGKDEQGWNVFKFSEGENWLEIGKAFIKKDGQSYRLTNINYYVNSLLDVSEFKQFLKAAGFEEGKVNYMKDGTPFTTWTGTRSLKDKLKNITISKRGDIYLIKVIS